MQPLLTFKNCSLHIIAVTVMHLISSRKEIFCRGPSGKSSLIIMQGFIPLLPGGSLLREYSWQSWHFYNACSLEWSLWFVFPPQENEPLFHIVKKKKNYKIVLFHFWIPLMVWFTHQILVSRNLKTYWSSDNSISVSFAVSICLWLE